jgi:uncharacterized protein YciI
MSRFPFGCTMSLIIQSVKFDKDMRNDHQRSARKKKVKTIFGVISLTVCLLLSLAFVRSPSPPQPRMVQFHMALFKKGPKWAGTPEQQRNQILQQHFASVMAMLASGKAAISGPLSGDPDLAGIFVLRASSAGEARAWVDADPAVKAGLFTAEMHPWWSQDIFKKANLPLKLNTVFLGFLKKGPNRKDGDAQNPEVQELQKAHIANINRLAEMKKLIVAGPFGDDGELRGIFVFRVASLQEAQELSATDPMIKIGRLSVELHAWQVPDGVLP